MNFFPHLLTMLAVLLPLGRGEIDNATALAYLPLQHAERSLLSPHLIHCPGQCPAQSESYFECLEETALDEEDSTRVEEHGIVPLTFLNIEGSLANHCSPSLLPASPHSQLLLITPILRC